jgi:hypothetical protein
MLSALFFLCAFLGLVAMALWRYPICGLFLYIGVFYVHPPSRWWGDMLPDLRWSLSSAAVAVLAVLLHRKAAATGRRAWISTIPALVILLFLLWMGLQAPMALDSEAHNGAIVHVLKYLVMLFLVYRLADSLEKASDVLLAHVAGCAYLGWLCFVSGRTGDGRLDGVGGPGIDDANTLGMVLATGVVAAAALALTQQRWRRWVAALSIPLMLNGLILTGSRGAFLGLLGGSLTIALLCPPGRRLQFAGAAVLGVVLALNLVDAAFVERMFTITAAVKDKDEIDSSAESRVALFEAQKRMFAAYPLGCGHRGTAVLSVEFLDRQYLTTGPTGEVDAARSSHNTFMTVLVEQGVVGVLLFVWMTLWGLTAILRVKRLQSAGAPPQAVAPAIAACGALTVVWVSGQFTDYLLAEVQIWMYALLAASLDLLRRRNAQAVPAEAAAAVPASSYSHR